MKKLEFNFPGISLATIESQSKDTGLTLVKFDKPSMTVCDIRGGAAAVRESSSIDEINVDGVADAITLAGGSTFGLEAASGVMKMLREERNNSTNFNDIPCVPGAIVYDYRQRTDKTAYPTKEMGVAAYERLVRNQLSYGAVGGGANVWVGKYLAEHEAEKSGQGAAFFQFGEIRILAISVVNAVGNIVDREGKIKLGSLQKGSQSRSDILERVVQGALQPEEIRGNTTISLIVTNARISRQELKRLSIMAHTGMARVIEPFHTPWDGDVLFATSTQEAELPTGRSAFDLSLIATKVMQDAVLSLVD